MYYGAGVSHAVSANVTISSDSEINFRTCPVELTLYVRHRYNGETELLRLCFSNVNFKTVPRRYFFCGSFMFLFCLVFAMFCARLFIYALWSPAGKGLTSWLSFVVSSVSLSLSHWYPGSGVVLDCIDS